MIRVLLASTNIFVSLVVGALAMALVWIKYPHAIDLFFTWAGALKTWLTSRGISVEYNNFIRLLVEERQLVFMGFVVVTRIVLASLVAIFAWLRRQWMNPTVD